MSLESLTIYRCHELEHIVVDIGDGSGGNELGINVFPKLKELYVHSCEKLEYIFGRINTSDDDHEQNNNEIQLHLPALETLKLVKLQSLISLCPKQYHTTFPPLKELEVGKCSQVDVKSIGDFTFLTSISRYQDNTTIEQFSGNIEHFLALERLNVYESNVESILCLNAESEQQIDLRFQNIFLRNLPMMIYLFVGPKNAFALKNLKSIVIYQCEKLEIVFSTSVLRCLSQLSHLTIQECTELKHIIEDDDDIENQRMSNFMPVLETLAVVKCNKLKSIFPISMSKVLPKLEVIIIGEADELEEIFKSVGDHQKVEIPNLKGVLFVNLPSLCQVRGIQFQTVEHCLVHNCKKIAPTTSHFGRDIRYLVYGKDGIDSDVFRNIFDQLEDMVTSSQKESIRTPEAEDEFNENVPDLEIPSVATLATNSKELISEQSTSQQHSLGENDTTIKLSQGDYLEGSMSTISETRNVPPIHVDLKQKGIQVSIEEGTASTSYANTITSSTDHLESEYGDGQIAIPFSVSQELMNEQSMHQQRLRNQEPPLGEIDATMESSQVNNLEGATSEKTEAATMSTISEPKNEPVVQLYAPKQKGIKISVEEGTSSTHSKSVSSSSGLSTTSMSETSSLGIEEGTTSTCDKTITSSTHLEDGDGKISIPSFSTVNKKPPTTKYVDIVDSQEIIAMEDINKLIEEDPLLALVALEKLLTGQVSISSVRVLLQELKTLMDSSSDLDHLVSNQESISKLNSLFHRLNQHQGMLTSDLKDFVEKVQNFFNENIIKHTTSQQVLEKHNQLLDSKTDLMKKLWSVKSTQTHIDSETSTTNAQIHELSLQIDELRKKLADLENQRDSLKSVANKCDVQKMKLKAECTELVQQSKIFFSALASSDVSVREAEHARNLAKEGFANLKSSFPRF
ncbi:hypothetical protein P8452_24922 [Trifolium repens]|nr:hypothetical protein P8452_24922 [Trifolium repens]